MFAFAVLYGFVPTKARILDLEAWQIGVILGAGALIHSILSYLTGALSDRYGRNGFVVVSQVLVVGGVVGIILSDGFAGMLASYGVFCVGETMTLLLSFVYAAETFGASHIGASMAVFDAVLDLSLLAGSLLAVSIHSSTGLNSLVFVMAIIPTSLAFFAAALWLPRRVMSSDPWCLTLHDARSTQKPPWLGTRPANGHRRLRWNARLTASPSPAIIPS